MSIVAQIKDRLGIIECMREFGGAEISKQGKVWIGWHAVHPSESKTSLHVDPDKGIYHCFNCGQGGDIFHWVGYMLFDEQYDNGDPGMFKEVLERIASRLGLEVDSFDPETTAERRILEDIFDMVADFYHKQLTDEHRTHLHVRYGFTDTTINELKLGYAPVDSTMLFRYLTDSNVPVENIIKTGLLVRLKDGTLVDLFQGRLVFPYWKYGRPVYFIGRVTDETPDKPWEQGKYKKQMIYSEKHPHVSPQVQNNYFYGEDRIRSAQLVVVTEGLTDQILASQEGFPSISPCTTRFREKDWSKLLELTRHVKDVFIANDSEVSDAGINGALATAEMLWRNEKQVRLVDIPRPENVEKIDLNDFLRAQGAEAFKTLLFTAGTLLDVKVELVKSAIERKNESAEIDTRRQVFELLCWFKDKQIHAQWRKTLPKRLGIGKGDYDQLLKEARNKHVNNQYQSNSPELAEEGDPLMPESWPYAITNDCLCLLRETINEHGYGSVAVRDIARFSAQIVEESVAEDGGVTYLIEGTSLHGGKFTAEINAVGYSNSMQLKSILERAAGPRDPVFAGMEKHLGPAIKMVSSNDIKRKYQYNRTGWSSSRFLMPGRESDDTVIHLPSKLAFHIDHIAVLAKGLEGLKALMQTIDPLYASILASAIIGPPIARLAGWRDRRYVVFLSGQTGTFKTSIVQAFMSIYGSGFMDDDNLLAWGTKATPNAIMKLATSACDLPFFIDNYKANTGGGAAAFISMIHAIIEGGEKDRLNRSAEYKDSKAISAWPICTGEDVPDNDAAALARILIVPSKKRDKEAFPELTRAQELSSHLCAIGDSWLEWLESDDGKHIAKAAGNRLNEHRGKWSKYLFQIQPEMANKHRVATSLSINELSFEIAAQHPHLNRIFRPYLQFHKDGLTQIANMMAGLTAHGLEAQRFIAAIRELLASGKAVLRSKDVCNDASSFTERGRVIGWQDGAGGAYLLPKIARSVVAQELDENLNNVSSRSLYGQLETLGYLGEKDVGRRTKQKKLNGTKHEVIHILPYAMSGSGKVVE